MLTNKARVLAALHGGPLDRFPVAVPYIFLLQCDHWVEITAQPAWTYYAWLLSDPGEAMAVYERFDTKLPFDILQPWVVPSAEQRAALEVVAADGRHYYRHRKTGDLQLLNLDLPHSAGVANEERRVWNLADAQRLVKVRSAHSLLESGRYDHIREARKTFSDYFLMNGVVGTFWQCTGYLGETNLFALLHDEPELVEYLSARFLERTIEEIRALAAAGDDAIYIDDALTTCDLISPAFYERFSMPYVREMVREIHKCGKKAVLIYFGGVADRVPQILSLGADALSFETSMKGYTNDLGRIAAQASGQTCLWGNIDPLRIVQNATTEQLTSEILNQAAIGRFSGRFIISTGSPITPLTPLSRIRRFIDLAREAGKGSVA